jgi:CheY-like chemotaxis protein
VGCEVCGAEDIEFEQLDGCPACEPDSHQSGVFLKAAAIEDCSVTGVYESSCACSLRTGIAKGDPFPPCPMCELPVTWRLLAARPSPVVVVGRPRVLLVEDDNLIANAVRRAMRRAGIQLTIARSCSEARSLASALRFDVGIFDFSLRDGNGVELAQRLIAARRLAAVVFFTGEGSAASVVEHARTLGSVLLKGCSSEHLLREVEAAWQQCLFGDEEPRRGVSRPQAR